MANDLLVKLVVQRIWRKNNVNSKSDYFREARPFGREFSVPLYDYLKQIGELEERDSGKRVWLRSDLLK